MRPAPDAGTCADGGRFRNRGGEHLCNLAGVGSDEVGGVHGSEAEALRSAFPPADAVDEFGVPVNLLGPHPPEVWVR